MSKHMMPQGSKEYMCMNFQNNAHKFQKISYSGIIPFVHEVSMTAYMDRTANQKYQNGFHLITASQNH